MSPPEVRAFKVPETSSAHTSPPEVFKLCLPEIPPTFTSPPAVEAFISNFKGILILYFKERFDKKFHLVFLSPITLITSSSDLKIKS